MIGKTLKFTGGLLAGLGIGALTALLLAPQSGKLSVEQLQGRLDEIADAARRASRQTEDELYTRWEAQLTEATKKEGQAGGADDAEARAKARKEAADKERKAEEKKQKEAEEHLENARKELEKARKAV